MTRAATISAMVPTGSGSVQLREVPPPLAAPGELVVAVEAYSVNRGETLLLDAPAPGWRPGKDVAGTVAVAAADGTGPAVGRRVVGHPESGGWAERVAVPVDRTALLPAAVDMHVGATLPLAGLTALRLLRTAGPLAGRRLLITGASGGVGHYLVELAAAQGAEVTAVAGSAKRGARLLELGATGLVTEPSSLTGRYDVIIESVGGAMLPAVWRLLDDHGLLIWMGQASGERPVLDFFDWTGGANATLRKFLYSDSPTSDAEDLATLVRLVERGLLHPEIDRVVDWRRTPEVLDALLARQIRGNAVLEVTS